METIDLSARSHYILGRHESTADVVMAHPSVSRQHAVVQHSYTGEVFLMDLDSTHGTSINKKKLTPSAFVALRLGASVRLGQSSRTLTLMGESDPTREDPTKAAKNAAAQTEALEQRAAARAERIAKQTGKSMVSAMDLHSEGAGWGFDAEAEAAADGGGDGGADGAAEGEYASAGFEELVAMAKSKGLRLSAKQERLIEQLEKRTRHPHPSLCTTPCPPLRFSPRAPHRCAVR